MDSGTFEVVPGQLFAGRYYLEKLLGEGGMGRVYLVKDTLLESEVVALKVLHGDLSRNEKHSKRFLREVQLARKVSHPNIVRTFDAGTVGGQLYFTMEYAPGQSLKERLQFGALGAAEVCRILIEILGGLSAIHQCGIIHRDLKPANVILGENGSVKIADFGIARNGVSDLTGHDELVGSIAYLAPELWNGRDVSDRADLYALGVMAYEMLTGELPFEAEAAATMMCKHLQDRPVPPIERAPAISGWLNNLVLKLLEKDPAKRPQSAEELKKLIQSALKTDSQTAHADQQTANENPVIIGGLPKSAASKTGAPVRSIKIISAPEHSPPSAASSVSRVKLGVVRQRAVLKQTNSAAFSSQTIQSVARGAAPKTIQKLWQVLFIVPVAAALQALVVGPGWELLKKVEPYCAGLPPTLFLAVQVLSASAYLSVLVFPVVLTVAVFRFSLAGSLRAACKFTLAINLVICLWIGWHAVSAGVGVLPQAYAITQFGVINGIRSSIPSAVENCLLLAPFGRNGLGPNPYAAVLFLAAVYIAALTHRSAVTPKEPRRLRRILAALGIAFAISLQNVFLTTLVANIEPPFLNFDALPLWHNGPFTIVVSSAQLIVSLAAWVLLTGLLSSGSNRAKR